MQTSVSHKTKQLFALAIKLAIVIGASYFIYNKIAHDPQLNLDTFLSQIANYQRFQAPSLFVLILATFLNWLFEILKWKTLVQHIKLISLWESTAHTLGGLTASIFTPNRIGEYGAKALYFPRSERKRVLGLNLIGNLAQLVTTIFFGLIGFAFFVYEFGVSLPWYKILRMCIALLLFGGIFFTISKQKRFHIKGFSWERLRSFMQHVSGGIHKKNLSFSVIRYLIFSHQFYFLLLLFDVNASYMMVMSTIAAMYLITSFIPMLFLFDVVVKGSVAVWLFSYIGFPELSILSVVLLMWIFNFVIPSIVGSYFVLSFRSSFTEEKSVTT